MTIQVTIVVRPDFVDALSGDTPNFDLKSAISDIAGVSVVGVPGPTTARVEGSQQAISSLKQQLGEFCAIISPQPFVQASNTTDGLRRA